MKYLLLLILPLLAFADETDKIVKMMNSGWPGIDDTIQKYPNYWDKNAWPSGMIYSMFQSCDLRLMKTAKATFHQRIVYCTCTTDAMVKFHHITKEHILRCDREMKDPKNNY